MVGTAIEFDTILEVCQDQRRRIVLSKLATEKGSVTVEELAAAIAGHEHRGPRSAVPEEVTTQIRIELVHTHIPKLEGLSLVEYDRERKRVTPTPRFEQLAPEFTAIVEADPVLETPTIRELA